LTAAGLSGGLAARREQDAVDAGGPPRSAAASQGSGDPRESRGPARMAARHGGSPGPGSRPGRRIDAPPPPSATPGDRSNPAVAVSCRPSTSTTGIRRAVACSTRRSSAWPSWGVTRRRRGRRPATNASSTGWRPATSSSSSAITTAAPRDRAVGPAGASARIRPAGPEMIGLAGRDGAARGRAARAAWDARGGPGRVHRAERGAFRPSRGLAAASGSRLGRRGSAGSGIRRRAGPAPALPVAGNPRRDPRAARASRRRSDAAQSRALRAAARSSTSAWRSASRAGSAASATARARDRGRAARRAHGPRPRRTASARRACGSRRGPGRTPTRGRRDAEIVVHRGAERRPGAGDRSRQIGSSGPSPW